MLATLVLLALTPTPTATPSRTPTPVPVYCGTGWCQNPANGQCVDVTKPNPFCPLMSCCAPFTNCVESWACGTVTPTPTPTPPGPTPTPTPTPTGLLTVTLDPDFVLPRTYGWYAPDCKILPLPWPGTTGITVTDPYWCSNTEGDRILLETSVDGHVWTVRQPLLEALLGTWQADGGGPWNGTGYPTGISNMAITQSRYDGRFIAAYTAGISPNNEAAGGIGLATSGNGVNWNRYPGNPITRRPYGEFVQHFLHLPSGLYLYVTGNNGTSTIAFDERTATPLGPPVSRPGIANIAIIGYDPAGCWGAGFESWDDDVGYTGKVTIYNRGDCFTTPGVAVATFKPEDYGHSGIAGIGFVEQAYEGGLLGGPSVLVALGDNWGDWTPHRLFIGPQKALARPPVRGVPTPTP